MDPREITFNIENKVNSNNFPKPDGKKGRYLFGDYSSFDENRNFVNMLKDFVSISNNIIQIHHKTEKLRLVLKNVDLLQNNMVTQLNEFRRSSEESFDAFHEKYNEGIINSMFPTVTGTDPFLEIKNVLIQPLIDGEREYIRYFQEYRNYIRLRIIESYNNAATLLQTFLSQDYFNLQSTLGSNTSTVVEVSINKDDEKTYRISRTTLIMPSTYRADSAFEDNEGTRAVASFPYPLSYSLIVESSHVDFWMHRRKVSDIGIEQMQIPVGFKTPIYQKLKRSLRLVSGANEDNNTNHHDEAEKQPELVAIEHFYLACARLESDKRLSLTLANDISESEDKVIKIDYDLADFNTEGKSFDYKFEKLISEGRFPKIDYVEKHETRTLNLLKKEFIEMADISKILVLGKALSDKMGILLNSNLISSHIRLETIKVTDKEAITISNDGLSSTPRLHYDEELVLSFLSAIAAGFSPVIKKLKKKVLLVGN